MKSESLRIDTSYRNTNNWRKPQDEFNRFFRFADGKGINNTSGFRPKSRVGSASTDILQCAFCVLVTNFGEQEWPDFVDRENGIFTYYGDNRSPGELHDTVVGGNRLLQAVYASLHSRKRPEIRPFLCFESYPGDDGMYMRFLGLACPGGEGVSQLEDLVAVWRLSGVERFQNYRAIFTILKTEKVSRDWLEDLVSGVAPVDSKHCPPEWRRWVETGLYTPLKCARQIRPRSKDDQLPGNGVEQRVLRRVYEDLTDRQFEFAAAELLQLMDQRFSGLEVTRAVRDGGRDIIGNYKVGHDLHQVSLDAYVEAKRWNLASSIGVKPMMRLISRIKHRDIGVFMATSYFNNQVQAELIEDGHPVILISGGDIAKILVNAGYDDEMRLTDWLDAVKLKSIVG